MKYYEVKVKLEIEAANNKVKTITETYLVDAQSVTEAEANTVGYFEKSQVSLDYEVTEVKPSKVIDVVSK